jgi:hypothetical protein
MGVDSGETVMKRFVEEVVEGEVERFVRKGDFPS